MTSSYKKVTEWLFDQLPMYQRIGKSAYKADLVTTLEMDERMGHPHKNFRSIHVAGTNGKGSVCHMTAAVLQRAGYKVGLYTSPHLADFRERIRVNGEMISQREVVEFTERHMELFEELKPSFFEMTVAMAFDHFSRHRVDVAVIETGMGGRLDSTNIIQPELSVITNIGFDHTEFLGDTLEKIAMEKAGIIKEGVPLVVGDKSRYTRKVFEDKAASMKSALYFANDYFQVPWSVVTPDKRQYFDVCRGKRNVMPELWSDQLSFTQRQNLPVVLEVLELLRIHGWSIADEAVYAGLSAVKETTGFRGRWEVVSMNPRMVLDTGHNAEGIRQVMMQVASTRHIRLHFVYGAVGDKNIDHILNMLPQDAVFYFTQPSIPRALDVKLLAAKAAYYGLTGTIHETVRDAVAAARKSAGSEDLILIGGSTFVVADAIIP